MTRASSPARIHTEITGIVQGVGFRPFLHRLAAREQLTGWARNTPAGVELELEGEEAAIRRFVQTVKTAPPPLAVVEELKALLARTPYPDIFIRCRPMAGKPGLSFFPALPELPQPWRRLTWPPALPV